MYSSQRMKDWTNIVNVYQKNGIYLAEAISILQRNVAYEIPALKKQINKLQQQQTECEEKHESLNKNINEINHQIKINCNELEIEGSNIGQELKSLPTQLDSVFDQITLKCQDLESPVKFYSNYIEYFFQRKLSDSLPILAHIIHKGNTTVYEWRTGTKPNKIEKTIDTTYNFIIDDDKPIKDDNKDDVINFDTETETIAETIDFGDDVNESVQFICMNKI
jgi:hypothetical protein